MQCWLFLIVLALWLALSDRCSARFCKSPNNGWVHHGHKISSVIKKKTQERQEKWSWKMDLGSWVNQVKTGYQGLSWKVKAVGLVLTPSSTEYWLVYITICPAPCFHISKYWLVVCITICLAPYFHLTYRSEKGSLTLCYLNMFMHFQTNLIKKLESRVQQLMNEVDFTLSQRSEVEKEKNEALAKCDKLATAHERLKEKWVLCRPGICRCGRLSPTNKL